MISYILTFVVGVLVGGFGLLIWLAYFGVPAMISRAQDEIRNNDPSESWRTGENRLDDDIYN